MTFYDRVNELCRERGISITALALALGFSKGTPSNWKTMTKPPRAENVKKVAEYFGIKCYDKELLSRAAKESGFCEEMIENHDERPTNSFLYNLVMDTYSFGYNASSFVDMPISHKVFLAQFDTIKKIADEGPCVIVGRCADYILKDDYDVVSVFITASSDYRAKRTAEYDNISMKEAQSKIVRMDKARASYHNYHAETKWGASDSYELCINSERLTSDAAAELIKSYIASRSSDN